MSYFSNALKYLREREKLTQLELAEALGLTRSRLSMYETGAREPDFQTLAQIAEFFDVPVDALINRDGDGNFSEKVMKTRMVPIRIMGFGLAGAEKVEPITEDEYYTLQAILKAMREQQEQRENREL